MNYLFTTLPSILKKAYSGKNLFFQILACVLTYLSLMSGFDWYYFVHAQVFPYKDYLHPALFLGFLLPIILPGVVVIVGALLKRIRLTLYGLMMWQAAFLGWFISSFYKAFTGRIQPSHVDFINDISHGFQFGFWKHGIFWGWPSSHTATAFALSFAIITTTKNRFIQAAAFAWALYVGIGISLSIHWFSEFIAGALIGAAIGISVGIVWKKILQKT